jgi:hypothetical protein
MMKCLTCKHGQTNPGLVTVTLEREELIVIIAIAETLFDYP